MTWERQRAYDFQAGQEKGIVIGERQKAIENAKNFLKEGDPPEKIARCIGLPLEEVQKLAEELQNI